jgi:hypothetical protein
MMEDSNPRLPPALRNRLGPNGAFDKVVQQNTFRMMKCAKMFHHKRPARTMVARTHQLKVQRKPKAGTETRSIGGRIGCLTVHRVAVTVSYQSYITRDSGIGVAAVSRIAMVKFFDMPFAASLDRAYFINSLMASLKSGASLAKSSFSIPA